jgi:5-formyltetrahydrofolate cyclo-ligase
MRHFLLTENTVIKPNKYGIPEPAGNGIEINPMQLDVVVVPLLGCDLNGNRLGYGGGFYDRFLAQCKPDCLKIGLDFYPPLDTKLPSESTDVRLDMLVWPEGVRSF